MVKKNERVFVAGKEVSKWEEKHHRGIVGGLFLITIGIIFLLNTVGIISWDVWGYLWQFWPVLLILGGLHVILGNSPLASAIMAIVALVVFVVMIIFAMNYSNPIYSRYMPRQLMPMYQQWRGDFNEYR